MVRTAVPKAPVGAIDELPMALAIGAIQHLANAPVGPAEFENPYCPATTQHRLSDFMRDLKAGTSKHFNETSGLIHKIGWQDGYGAFTVGKSQEDTVRRYIASQEQHHAKETFQVEYVRMLELSGADYDPRYLWD